jgi:hypothetical protein
MQDKSPDSSFTKGVMGDNLKILCIVYRASDFKKNNNV